MAITAVLQILSLTSLFVGAVLGHPSIPPDDGGSSGTPSSFQPRNEVVHQTFSPRAVGTSSSAGPFKALQFNLCNSGYAKCYEGGKAVPEAITIIKSNIPDVVTVNEICLNDVKSQLHPALAAAAPYDYTYYVFQPAINRNTNGAYKCKNGDLYGDAVFGRVSPSGKTWSGFQAFGGMYISQDTSTSEERTFACAAITGGGGRAHFTCTTHLATDRSVAVEQCQALMFDAVPYLKGVAGASGHTVVGGDLNLKYDRGSSENAQNCVPNGYTRKGDSDVQHITFSNDFVFQESHKTGMDETDHDAWMVELNEA